MQKPSGPPYPMPANTHGCCRCICIKEPRCKDICDCTDLRCYVHQRIKHYYVTKDDFIDWVEPICLRCGKTRAFMPEYMATKSSIVAKP